MCFIIRQNRLSAVSSLRVLITILVSILPLIIHHTWICFCCSFGEKPSHKMHNSRKRITCIEAKYQLAAHIVLGLLTFIGRAYRGFDVEDLEGRLAFPLEKTNQETHIFNKKSLSNVYQPNKIKVRPRWHLSLPQSESTLFTYVFVT